MSPRARTIRRLLSAGWTFDRHGSRHDIYRSANGVDEVAVPRHNFDEDTERYVLKQAGIGSKRR